MAYVALYRKWRPMTFDEVVEQKTVVTVLKNAVQTGRIAHAYLFCGTRGTGKTTMAKIFARAVNCLNPQNGNPCNECSVCKNIINQQILDVSEIDAASNNGVDNIRTIIEETAFAASVAKYRVYIIDEVHMLSGGAFNALLKTLEEPPQNVIFILATTEPNKLPVTILSRCQRYDFKRISQEGIIGRLEEICKEQNIQYDISALAFLAQKSDGAMRDAISILDQSLASSGNNLTLASARAATGAIDKAFVEDFAYNIISSNSAEILKQVAVLFSEGRDPSDFIAELLQIFRNVLVMMTVDNTEGLVYETKESILKLKEIGEATNKKELVMIIKELSSLENSLKWTFQRKIIFETGMLNICDRKTDESDIAVEKRIDMLERRLSDLVNKGIRVSYRNNGNISQETVQNVTESNQAIQDKQEEIPHKEENKQNIHVEKHSKSTEHVQPAETPKVTTEHIEPVAKKKKVVNNSQLGMAEPNELDWKDFLSGIADKGQASLSALVKINCKGMLDGKGNLILIFSSPIVKDMIVKKDATDLLSESATQAFGKRLRVVYAVKGDDLTLFPGNDAENVEDYSPAQNESDEEEADALNENQDSFQNSVDILKELSESDGFDIFEN